MKKVINGLSLQKFCKFCNLFKVSPNVFLSAFNSGILIMTNEVKDVKTTEVSIEEIKQDPTMRLDAKYWIKKKEEDEQKKIDVFSLMKKAKPMPNPTLGLLKVDITKKGVKDEKGNNIVKFIISD